MDEVFTMNIARTVRIAHSVDPPDKGPVDTFPLVASLTRSLLLRRHQVMIYTVTDTSLEGVDLDISGLRVLPDERFPSGRDLMAPIGLAREWNEFQPEVVHNHSIGFMGLQAMAAAHLLNIPILGTCHMLLVDSLRYTPVYVEGSSLTEDAAWRYTVAFLDRFPHVAVPSDIMKDALLAQGLQAPVTVVPNGVDISLFRSVVEAPPEKDHLPTVIHVGWLVPEKRLDVLLHSFYLLTLDYPQAHLVIAGEGPEEARLRNLASRLRISDHVQFLGHVTHDELPAIYKSADIYAAVSTIKVQGLAILEAMACGLPVVGVRSEALPDSIVSGVTALLVPPDDEQALAQALAILVTKPELRNRMGRNARRRVAYHNVQYTAAGYEVLYESLYEQTAHSKMKKTSVTPKTTSIWDTLQTEVRALSEAGVENAWETASALKSYNFLVS